MSAAATHLRWLFSPHGRVTRSQFVGWGCGLMAVKMLLDAALCTWVFGIGWTVRVYFVVPFSMRLHDAYGQFVPWWWLAAASLPFAWVGLTLSLRRLRDAGRNQWLIALFVCPFVNLVLFALLALLPTARVARSEVSATAAPGGPLTYGIVPALVASLGTVVLVALGTQVLATYGAGLFLGAPFLQGMLVGVLSRQRDGGSAFGQFCLSMLFSAVLMMVFAWEGLICILMATPLWLAMGMGGLVFARLLVGTPTRQVVPALFVLPLAQWVEPQVLPAPTVHEVSTEVVVHAPPAAIWRHLSASELPAPMELPFLAGIAYPVRSSTEGTGPGAARLCSFNTGDFVETIEVWDEPRRLVFSVQQCPPPMVEWNPLHDHVDAPHLHGTFLGHRGQFVLTARPDGTTLLTGTTWYSHGLQPEAYWSWWSDWLVHTIHRRVLAHIARCAEADVR